jgi:hypothetical protein
MAAMGPIPRMTCPDLTGKSNPGWSRHQRHLSQLRSSYVRSLSGLPRSRNAGMHKSSRLPSNDPIETAPTGTAVYGPVRTVVWQGSAGDRHPYADQTGNREIIPG